MLKYTERLPMTTMRASLRERMWGRTRFTLTTPKKCDLERCAFHQSLGKGTRLMRASERGRERNVTPHHTLGAAKTQRPTVPAVSRGTSMPPHSATSRFGLLAPPQRGRKHRAGGAAAGPWWHHHRHNNHVQMAAKRSPRPLLSSLSKSDRNRIRREPCTSGSAPWRRPGRRGPRTRGASASPSRRKRLRCGAEKYRLSSSPGERV